MTRPTLKVEAAFGDGPFATSKTWTDISDRVRSVRARHGRDQELQAFQAGSMDVELDNSDRMLDPSYAAGDYYGDLVPMVPIRAYWRSGSDSVTVSDTFTRANNASSLGSAEVGGAWTQLSFGAGAMGISSNQAYVSAVDVATNLAYQAGPSDGYVEADFTHADAEVADVLTLLFRADIGSFNGWQVSFASNLGQLLLVRLDGGVPTTVDTTTFPAAATVTVRAEFVGSQIRVFVDGVQVMSAADSTYASETDCGFQANLTAARIDNFEAGTLASTYPIGYGYVDGWPQDYQPPYQASVSLDCPDVFSVLANAPLEGGSPLAALIAADRPTHWYPLDDEEGASFFTDLGSDAVDGVPNGSATPGFGAAGMDVGDPDQTAWEADGTDAGSLDTRVDLFTEWDTLVFLIRADAAAGGTGRQILIDYAHLAVVRPSDASSPGVVDITRTVTDSGASGGTRSSVRVDDGLPHLVMLRRNGGTPKWTIYVDGESVGVAGAAGSTVSPPATCRLGGHPSTPSTNFLDGTLQHVAFFNSDKTSRAAAYYEAFIGWVGDLTGERIGRILDAIGHPSVERDLDDGTITLGVTEWSESTRALPELQAVEKTEQGKLYQAPDGTIIFRNRHSWVTATRSTTSQYTFSDDPTESLRYERGITLDTGVTQIINVVTVSWSGGTVVVKDQDSIDAYGPRDHQVTTAAPSAAVARSVGEYLISKYKDPQLRVEKITINAAAGSDATWSACLDVQVGDRVTVERHPQSVGTAIAQESIVEAKAWTIEEGTNEASVTLSLSPADTTSYFILSSATNESALDGTDGLG